MLINLKRLDLSKNSLTDISKLISLANLEVLILDSNFIKFIPNDIDELTKLKELHLSNNKLSDLPNSITNLRNLRILTMNNNQLVALPENIGNFKEIKQILFDNNKLVCLQKSILKIKNSLNISKSAYNIYCLSIDCKFIIIHNLETALLNLPILMKKIYLYRAKYLDIKAPLNSKIFLDDIEIDL